MNLNQITLPCTDMARSVAFYRQMGFVQIVGAGTEYSRFECPDGEATFSLHRVDEIVKNNGVVIYFECEQLDQTVQQLAESGIKFAQLPTDQPWLWREARLFDPDGNQLCLFYAGKNRCHPPWRLDP